MAERRDALPPEERLRLSQEAAARLAELPELEEARMVSGFIPLGAEIDPGPALDALLARGAVVVYPRVSKLTPRLRFHRITGPSDLRPGPLGLREPDPACPEVAPEQIDVFVVPGMAFDRQGRRLGYGGGFYEEVLAAARKGGKSRFVAFGFDFQVVDHCPAGERDVLMDCVVTDARVLRRVEHQTKGVA